MKRNSSKKLLNLLSGLGFPTEFCYERVSQNRDKTNFVITRNKVVAEFRVMRNGLFRVTKRHETKLNDTKKYIFKELENML